MPKKINLTEALQEIRKFSRDHKRPPSYDEIARIFHYKSKNAAFWLVKTLKDKGMLSADPQGKLLIEAPGGARLLGTVQAGFPSPAEEETADLLSLDEYLIRHPEQTFLVKVNGDSMIDAGVREGDLAVVERARAPRDKGDIVIAQVDGQWTMKYYEKRGREVVLIAANKKYPPMRPSHELVLGGVVTGIVRKYK